MQLITHIEEFWIQSAMFEYGLIMGIFAWYTVFVLLFCGGLLIKQLFQKATGVM